MEQRLLEEVVIKPFVSRQKTIEFGRGEGDEGEGQTSSDEEASQSDRGRREVSQFEILEKERKDTNTVEDRSAILVNMGRLALIRNHH